MSMYHWVLFKYIIMNCSVVVCYSLQKVQEMGVLNEIPCITRLSGLQLKPGPGGIKALFAEVDDCKLSLEAAGRNHPDTYFIPFIIKSLPARYGTQKDTIKRDPVLASSLPSCQTYLEAREAEIAEEYQQEQRRRAAQNQLRPRGGGRANAVFNNFVPQGEGSGRGGGNSSIVCWKCHKVGHKRADCTNKPHHFQQQQQHQHHAPAPRAPFRGGKAGGRGRGGHFRRQNPKQKYMGGGRANAAWQEADEPAPAQHAPAQQPPALPAPASAPPGRLQGQPRRVNFER